MALIKEILARLGNLYAFVLTAGGLFGVGYGTASELTGDKLFALECGGLSLGIAICLIGVSVTSRRFPKLRQRIIRNATGQDVPPGAARGPNGSQSSDPAISTTNLDQKGRSNGWRFIFVAGILGQLFLGYLLIDWKLQNEKWGPYAPSKEYGIYVSDFIQIGNNLRLESSYVTKHIVDRMSDELIASGEKDVFIRNDSIGAVVRNKYDASDRLQLLDGGECIVWGNVVKKPRSLQFLETNILFIDPFLDHEVLRKHGIDVSSWISLDKNRDLDVVLEQELIGHLNCTILLGIGILKFQRKDFDGAKAILQRALTACNEERAEANIPYVRFFLMLIHLQKENQELASDYWFEADRDLNMQPSLREAFGLFKELFVVDSAIQIDSVIVIDSRADGNRQEIVDSAGINWIATADEPIEHLETLKTGDLRITTIARNSFELKKEAEIVSSSPGYRFKVIVNLQTGLQGVQRISDSEIVVPIEHTKIWITKSGQIIVKDVPQNSSSSKENEILMSFAVKDTNNRFISSWYPELGVFNDGLFKGLMSKRPWSYSLGPRTIYVDPEFLLVSIDGTDSQGFCLLGRNGLFIPEKPVEQISTKNHQGYYKVFDQGKSGYLHLPSCYYSGCIFDNILTLEEGEIAFAIDLKSGRMKTEIEFENSPPLDRSFISNFYTTLLVNIEDKWGMELSNGTQIIPIIYDQIAPPYFARLIRVRVDSSWGYYDRKDNVIIEPQFEQAGLFNGAHAIVIKDGKYGVINTSGIFVVSPIYEFIDLFHDGWAVVKTSSGFNYVNVNGTTLLKLNVSEAERFRFGVAIIKENNSYGIINGKGESLIESNFDKIYYSNKFSYKGDFFIAKRRKVCVIFDVGRNKIGTIGEPKVGKSVNDALKNARNTW